jgi:hypothetical protein
VPAPNSLGRVGWVALVVAMGLLAAVELGMRRLGFQPSVKDTPELWSLVRARASEGDENTVVLLGSSRFQGGLVLDELSRALGGARVLQLAIGGSSSLPVLEDLAEDEGFRGRVLCEVSPTFFFSVGPVMAHARPARYVAQHRRRAFAADWETALRLPFQERLVMLLSDAHPRHVLRELLRHRALPRPSLSRVLASREQHVDLEGQDVTPLREQWAWSFRYGHGREPEPAELEALLERLASAVERIRARGGEVIFVRMVSSGEVRRIEDERYPRERYWDRLVQRTGKGLSFEDIPELARFQCPEDSHLDRHAAPDFTRVLGQELRRYPAGAVSSAP